MRIITGSGRLGVGECDEYDLAWLGMEIKRHGYGAVYCYSVGVWFYLFTTFFPTISMEIIHLVSAESVVLEVTYDCIQCRRSRGS